MARQLERLAVGLALAAAAWAAGAQAPAPAKKPAAQAPAAKKPARLYYDRYEASQRQRLRRDTCMRDEDMIAQFCVKKCQTGYVVENPGKTPRDCRSEKPLPEGQLPEAGKRQRGNVSVPPPPLKPVPGA